jgi:ATP-dependent Clp protease adapter protein ClpS
MEPGNMDLSKRRFMVCLDELRQNFVSGEQFTGGYTKTVTLCDGSTRTIELTPMIRDGLAVVELKDTGHHSFMGPNGTTTNGTLMVRLLDVDAVEEWLRRHRPQPPVLPPDTSLLTLPEFVPAGFVQGVEILNDNATPMEFVVSMLSAHLGLSAADSQRAMLDIHNRGGGLFPTPSLAQAALVAAQIAADAKKQGHPLVCRAVGIEP